MRRCVETDRSVLDADGLDQLQQLICSYFMSRDILELVVYARSLESSENFYVNYF